MMSSSRAEFAERVERWIDRTHLRPTRVRLRRMTRLWAVCNVDDSITFSTALLEQPDAFQDLVIVHELVHLQIRDHGPHFRAMLAIFLPDHIRIARMAPESPAIWLKGTGVRDERGVYRVRVVAQGASGSPSPNKHHATTTIAHVSRSQYLSNSLRYRSFFSAVVTGSNAAYRYATPAATPSATPPSAS